MDNETVVFVKAFVETHYICATFIVIAILQFAGNVITAIFGRGN